MLPSQDGMAALWAYLTAPDALTCHGWLTALARGLGRDDPRSMDQRRADLLTALITGRLSVIAAGDSAGDTIGDGAAAGPGSAGPATDAAAAATDGANTSAHGLTDRRRGDGAGAGSSRLAGAGHPRHTSCPTPP